MGRAVKTTISRVESTKVDSTREIVVFTALPIIYTNSVVKFTRCVVDSTLVDSTREIVVFTALPIIYTNSVVKLTRCVVDSTKVEVRRTNKLSGLSFKCTRGKSGFYYPSH